MGERIHNHYASEQKCDQIESKQKKAERTESEKLYTGSAMGVARLSPRQQRPKRSGGVRSTVGLETECGSMRGAVREERAVAFWEQDEE